MRIEENETTVRAAPKSLNPELIFEITLIFQKKLEIPLEVGGVLSAADGMKIANVYGVIPDTSKDPLELAASDSENWQERKLKIQLITPLSKKGVDHLQTLRGTHEKGDVILELHIFINTLLSDATLSNMYLMEANELPPNFPEKYKKEGNLAQLVYYAWKGQFRSNKVNMWILSGNQGPNFLKMRRADFKLKVPISSSDWIHDFAPTFQIGKFSIFEFYLPDYTPGENSIQERLREAIKAVKKMEEGLIQGDWNQVIEDSRPVTELLRNEGEFRNLLMRDGYTEEASANLNKSIDEMFHFASKFIHKLDQSHRRMMPDIKASKEDAYLIHAISISLVNLISQKMKRLG